MSLRLSLELLQRRHGWPLRAGIAAMLVAAAVTVVAVWRAPEPAESIVQAVDDSRQLDERQRAFRGLLVPLSELDTHQRSVLEAAEGHGLRLGRIDYGFENNGTGRFAVATLQMPVRGQYPDFRAFLASMLVTHPAASVDDLSIQRDPAGDGIEARLRLTFHTEVRAEPRR